MLEYNLCWIYPFKENIHEKIQSMLDVGTTKGTICVEYFRFKKRSTPAPSKGFSAIVSGIANWPFLPFKNARIQFYNISVQRKYKCKNKTWGTICV